MQVDHIGYAVRDIEKAQKKFEVIGYSFEPVVQDDARGIYISFGVMDGYRIELVAPISKEIESPVDGVLGKAGASPYHICYKSGQIDADIERLQKERFKVTVPLAPAVAFGGKRVVFMYSLTVGLIEIVEE